MRLFLSGVVALSLVGAAEAADPVVVPVPTAEGWEFKISPYLWAAGLSGETRPVAGVPVVDLDLRFRDILEDLKFAGMVAGSAHRGRFGVSGDLQYVVIKSSSDALAPLFGRARLTSKTFIGTALADYKPVSNDRYEFILSGGARVFHVDQQLELTPGVLAGRSAGAGDTWVDPFFGVRGQVDITERIFVNGWAYIGGFGIGSDISSDLYAGLGYRFTETIAANLGYRWLHVDRDSGGFLWDVDQHGVMLGTTFSF